MNLALLIGRLGQDPETRATGGGAEVCNFSIATSEKYEKDGEKQEKTEWHAIVVWGKLAGICQKYLKKGQQVGIQGKLQTRQWEKDGQKHYKTEIVAFNVEFLSSRADGDRQGDSRPAQGQGQGQGQTRRPGPSAPQEPNFNPPGDDGYPF